MISINGGTPGIQQPMQNGLANQTGIAELRPGDGRRSGIGEGLCYDEGMRQAAARGMIKFVEGSTTGGEPDFFSHLSPRSSAALDLRPSNTRPLCPEALTFLQGLSGRECPRVLELGPGAGVSAAEIKGRLPGCRLETVSLSPINPFLWPTRRHAIPASGFSMVPRQDPYIDLQYVGDVDHALAAMKQQFDFIYDSFGALFWQLTHAARERCFLKARRLLQRVVDLVRPGGTLFVAASDGQLWLEHLLNCHAAPEDRITLFPPMFKSTQMRSCAFEKDGQSKKT
ncbi:class I SAM-dependent methyltransferase [Rhizobium leguminosarum]|uniref:class I SAM-dependent methyltransferase n=1 Tax=Rhizobium ruizarguesonis TaxID=2081791 RepID=UPI001A9801AD|nr:class I SAM-dependent methyltransferase [Rhizobium ruizarguesonis]MBY5890763.1 class I SAM-dependent methyltransferase [Rhizobium leguminosarum]QSZ05127.1 class I SAM-dependent methyltransferase [Rhizobium ruizarguesonis]